MAAGPVGTVWATGVWADTVWEEGVWGDAVVEYNLFTEGVYVMIDLGGGVVYLKPASAKIKASVTTGHVTTV